MHPFTMGTRIFNKLFSPAWPMARSLVIFSNPQNQKVLTIPGTLVPIRNLRTTSFILSKSKDRGKDKKSNKSTKVEVNPLMMSELISVDKLKEQCNAAIDKMKDEFVKNLSIRSTTGSIESLRVKFSGKEYELQELAQIVRKNPKTMVINFASFPQAIPDALKAIHASGLNLNPQQDGTTLFVPVPKVTKEHREALARNAKIIFVKCRDSIKDAQNESIKKAKKQKASEDLIHNVQKQILALCEEFQVQARQAYNSKHDELLGK